VDITQLILDDHAEQRRLFAILEQLDPADVESLSAVWDRLASFLELHAAAEEAIFYPALLGVGVRAGRAAGAEDETLDAIADHNDIRDAVVAVAGHQVGTGSWYAAVAAANLANSEHMGEEEREGLTDFRRLASLQLRHDLAVSFIAFEARNYAGVPPVDKDPAGYVHEEEQRQGLDAAAGPATDGPATAGPVTGGPATGGAATGGSAADGAATDGSLSIGSLRAG
jgi:Hemerythrin HHE cation binding domain